MATKYNRAILILAFCLLGGMQSLAHRASCAFVSAPNLRHSIRSRSKTMLRRRSVI